MQHRQAQSNAARNLGASALSQITDKALVQSMAAGDKRALKLLYLRHCGRVFRFIVRLVGNEATAEEVLNEVFLEAWRQADRFESRSQVATWLMAIARFKAIAERRRRSELQLDDKYAAVIPDPSDTPSISLEKRQRSAVLQTCLAMLTPAHREVINLIYYQGQKVEDVARFTGAPISTIKTRMHYARGRMAELLAAAGVDRGWVTI
jgi:RNA polymerase sigma-70 factor (ECF subfamily)